MWSTMAGEVVCMKQKPTLDDLQQMTLSQLCGFAMDLKDEPSLWLVAGMITAQAESQGYEDFVRALWVAGHGGTEKEIKAIILDLWTQVEGGRS